ncbi:uncharacterized protein A4U43_C06F17120 [Asparagus officinalis]|uniref:Potassium transporter n=1 Tax=Asparagus officinalis TaxID=4686 RepID=A0A5P1EMF7_ASPOF|nr:uncharacterized protein A4U43_C06F17120 [Asparagus officinalis]
MGGPVKTDTWKRTLLLAFQSLGVVFGHLSIGPLYVFHTAAPDEIKSKEMLYGLMSFVFWTMTLIPFVKYICIVLRVDDNGEGGTFALYSLLCRHARVGLLPNDQIEDDLCLYEDGVDSKAKNTVERSQKSRYMMWFMAMLGSCTVITSGVLVPTISVLSASSSLDRSLEELFFKSQRKREKFGERTEIPFAYAIIIALFVLQHFGTHKIGFLFAPIIIVWLLFIGGLGVYNILHWDQDVFWALSPLYMYKFINNLNIMNWRSLGGVLLCTAGSEAIFADLGHFSKRSIKIAFSLLVYPSLILCYLGQTAYISKNWKREGIDDVTHLRTSVPGLAIIIGMLITTCFMSLIVALYWNKVLLAACFLLFFGSIEAIYFLGCILNMKRGAWIVIVFVEVLLIIILSWHYGVMKKYQLDMENKVSIDWLIGLGPNLGVSRVPGIGFICTDITKGIPAFFSHFVTNLPAFHQVIVFVSFKSMPIPQVTPSMQLLIGRMGPKEYRVYRCIVRYGYRDGIRDINEFEDQIVHGIGEFISQDDGNSEASCWSPEGRVVVSGNLHGGNALITVPANDSFTTCERPVDVEVQKLQNDEQPSKIRKRVRFLLPPESPEMSLAVREELQELLDAREHGTTYILGKSQFFAQRGSNFLRRIIIGVYIFLVKNCREPSMLLNIPHAAHVEVGISYTI